MTKKILISLLLCHLILFNEALASVVAKENPENKEPKTTGSSTVKTTVKPTSSPESTTTQQPAKGVTQDEKVEKPEILLSQKETLEKPLPKKRGVLDELYRSHPGSFDETEYDTNDDAVTDESLSGSKSEFEEKPFYKYSDSAFGRNSRYFANEGRSKRTADVDEMYGRQEHEIELTPEELVALLNILEETRAYGEGHPSLWPYYDNNVDSIEADMRDEDIYKDRGENNFGGAFENNFDAYLPGMQKYPMGRRRRSSVVTHDRLNIPIFRRAIL